MPRLVRKLVAGEEGATTVEYALMVALIAAALVGVVRTLSSAVGGKFTATANAIGGSSGS